MGKKVKKKARSVQKEKRVPLPAPKILSQQCSSNAETPNGGVVVVKERGVCSHIDRGINLDKLSAKLGSSEPLKCEDCRGNAMDRRAHKGKSKNGKKGGINLKFESKAIWICLECGHFSCGGVGFPTTPQSHAVRHAKQNHHPLAVQFENPQLLWCFPCSNLITAEKLEDNGEHKHVLYEVAKMLKARPGEGSTVNVEDVWFGSCSVTSAIKSDYSASIGADGRAGYSVRGLINLGNTCFFNSTMQNLLAINILRDYLFKLDESVGPLSASLRKIFLETGSEAGLRSEINPRSVFGSLCGKAPQFRGYQQHDSHELLRCLLDGLSTEELSARKQVKSSQADGITSVTDPTFVDTIFGGQLSSTVSCLECGHSSTIYEPFLDLSLSIPTKPTSKQAQPVTRGKKPKLPPKRSGRIRSKVNRDAYTLPAESVSDQSTGGNSLGEVQSGARPAEQLVLSSGDSALSTSNDLNAIALDLGLTPEDLSDIQKPEDQQPVDNVGEQSTSLDVLTWLDYLEPNPVPNDIDVASETCEISAIQDSANENVLWNDISLPPIALDSSIRSNLVDAVSATSIDSGCQFNSLEQDNHQNTISQFDEKLSLEDSLAKEVVQYDAYIGHISEPCNQACSNDSNLNVCSSGMDDENPFQVQDSEVLLLPYKEEASNLVVCSAVAGEDQGSLEFDGFGDLFNEPEVTLELRPSDHHVSEASDVKNGVIIGNSSDSDRDEVDNTDAPVSIDSCLALFTKPELLSKDEHAWRCDNCSKVLHAIGSRRKLRKHGTEIVPNGCDNKNPSGLLDGGEICCEVNIMNGNLEKHAFNASDDRLLSQNGEIYNGNGMFRKHPETEMNVITCQSENRKHVMINSCHGLSECSSFTSQNFDSCSGECDTDRAGLADSDLLTAKCELEVREEEEVDSENLKVKRDATKNILINKAPSILTIHLKRFSQDARGRLSKLNGHVNFRETIDLKPYMDFRCTKRETHNYRLVGVVEHLGSMRSGHYVAYVRGGAERNEDSVWYHASDAYVREASLEEVLRCEAYILFYEGT